MVPRRVLFSLLCCIILAIGLWLQQATRENSCEMSRMRPVYEFEFVPANDSPYHLLRYTGDRQTVKKEPKKTHAILFIPGHKGTFKQARSLGSHVRKMNLDMEVYTLDFQEEPTALHAALIWQQAHFTVKAVRAIMEMHTDAPHLCVVAHSLGGMVIRTALVLPKFPVGAVSTVITLAAPHQSPPINLDRTVDTLYTQLGRFWRTVETLPVSFLEQDDTHAVNKASSTSTVKGDEDVEEGMFSFVRRFFKTVNDTDTTKESDENLHDEEKMTQNSEEGVETKQCEKDNETCTPGDLINEKDIMLGKAPLAQSSKSEKDDHVTTDHHLETETMEEAVLSLSEGARQHGKARRKMTVEKAEQMKQQRHRFASRHLGNLTIISIGGGSADTHVPSYLTLMSGIGPMEQSWHAPSLVKCDHLALCWCAQLQKGIALGLMAATQSPHSPQERLQSVKMALLKETEGMGEVEQEDSNGAIDDISSSISRFLVDMKASLEVTLISLVSYRVWLVLPVWTAIGLLAVSAPILHRVLDVAPSSSLYSPSSLFLHPILHWPYSLFSSAVSETLHSLKQIPNLFWYGVTVSFFLHAALPHLNLLSYFNDDFFAAASISDDAVLSESLFDQSAAASSEGETAWYVQWFSVDTLVLGLKYVLYFLTVSVLGLANLVAAPSAGLIDFSQLFVSHMFPLVILYGALIMLLSLSGWVVTHLQFVFSKIVSIVGLFLKPLVWVYEKLSTLISKVVNFVLRRKGNGGGGGAAGSDISGEDMREEFRARQAAKSHVSVRNVQYFSSREKKGFYSCFAFYVLFHVKSINPSFLLRGLFSLDASFSDEVAISSFVLLVMIFGLWLSFVVIPSEDSEQAKYHALLFVLYAPMVPLSYGSYLHAKNVLFHPIPSLTPTPGILFDSCLDTAFFFFIFSHLFLARFRPLPRPRYPLREGLLPKLQLEEKKKKSVTSSPVTSSTPDASSSALVPLAQGWERHYQWRSGLTYYEHEESGELMYCEGGPGAIYEETDMDREQIGKDVYLGPSFKVILDRSDEFVDIWGQSFSKKKTSNFSNLSQFELEGVFEAALADIYCWVIALMYALVVFLTTLGTLKAYHTLSVLAISAAMLSFLHLRQNI